MSEKSTTTLKKSKMSIIGVVALIYSFVAAGAFGIEEAISASGPGVTLLMLLIFPFIWSFPLCEMVGELGSIDEEAQLSIFLRMNEQDPQILLFMKEFLHFYQKSFIKQDFYLCKTS